MILPLLYLHIVIGIGLTAFLAYNNYIDGNDIKLGALIIGVTVMSVPVINVISFIATYYDVTIIKGKQK